MNYDPRCTICGCVTHSSDKCTYTGESYEEVVFCGCPDCKGYKCPQAKLNLGIREENASLRKQLEEEKDISNQCENQIAGMNKEMITLDEKIQQLQDALSCAEEALKTCEYNAYEIPHWFNKTIVEQALSKIQSLSREGE